MEEHKLQTRTCALWNKHGEAEFDSKSSPQENPEPKPDDVARFDKSLQELKELRSQLQHAAAYSEMSFLKAEHKKKVLENTKEYICMAMVAVVDHIGSVSSNLECRISENNKISETEIRINCLNQRLLTCEHYVQNLALSDVRRIENFPTYNPRYISSSPILERSNGDLRNSQQSGSSEITHKSVLTKLSSLDIDVEKPRLDSTSGLKFSAVTSVHEGSPVHPKPEVPSFYFQETKKLRSKKLSRRSLQIRWRKTCHV